MNLLGDVLAGLIIGACFMIVFKGDELVVAMSRSAPIAAIWCEKDPSCFMTYEDYKDLSEAMYYLEKYEDEE